MDSDESDFYGTHISPLGYIIKVANSFLQGKMMASFLSSKSVLLDSTSTNGPKATA